MSLLDGLRHRWYVLRRGERYAHEQSRELGFHLELESMHRAATGLPDHEAELAARRAFGNVTYYREEVRRMSALAWMDAVSQDARYAWRGLKRSPGFTIAVIATLALGLGVNTATTSFLDRLFVRAPDAVTAPDGVRRWYVSWHRPKEKSGRLVSPNWTYPQYQAVRAAVGSTMSMALFSPPDSVAVVEGSTRVPARLSLVEAEYFPLLGIRPQIGRFFEGQERTIATPTPVIVLSDAFWRRHYGADPDVLRRSITVGSTRYAVIGVAPPRFTGVDIDAVDLWAPANMYPDESPRERWYTSFGGAFELLVRPGAAHREEQLLQRATEAFITVRISGFGYDSLAVVLAGPVVSAAGPGWQAQEVSISTRLAGVAAMVLLIACANVGNLLLVRATRRRREIAMRRALGVSRRRLAGQLLTESLLLAALGGAAAVATSFWVGTALRRLLLPSVQWATPVLDWRTLAVLIGTTMVVGVVAGLAPVLHMLDPDINALLKTGAGDGGRRRSSVRGALVVVQVGLSAVLLIGAVLFVQSLRNVTQIDVGFDIRRTVAIRPVFADEVDRSAEVAAALPRVAERLRSAPGIQAIAYSDMTPMRGSSSFRLFLPGQDSLPPTQAPRGAARHAVSPGYVAATGMQLVAGRDFEAQMTRSEMIITETMARAYWPAEDPIGKCVHLGSPRAACAAVVGVVRDVHHYELIEEVAPFYFTQVGPTAPNIEYLVARIDPEALPTASEAITAELRRELPAMERSWIRPLSRTLAPQLRPWRLGATLFTALGVLALLVAAIGVYSVAAYAVSSRSRELSIRIALGARLSRLVTLLVGEATPVIVAGVVAGVLTALALGRLAEPILYGVSARDPVITAACAVAMAVIAAIAIGIPAWRAGRIDPASVLRGE